jgi:uncharacterized protein (TIGR03067 family)
MRLLLLVRLLVAPLVTAAPLPPITDDAKALQGTWTVVSFQAGSDKLPDHRKPTELVVKDDTLTLKAEAKDEGGTFKLNMAKKPKELDLTLKDGDSKPELALFIYDLDGDNLKLCWRKPGGARPTAFTAEGNDGYMVLKRKK